MEETGKRVAWVELYLDLVFVLAVGRLAHLIVAEPEMRSVWIALGLFVALWWTWVGFAVLYSLVAAMLLAAALWWLYFDSAASVNLKVLELSGGSPTMARAIFAGGHMVPAFALLLCASGVGLLLEKDPPQLAYWLLCVGAGIYLAGTRTLLLATGRISRLARILVLLATFQLARLEGELSPHAYLWLVTAWVTGCAAITTRGWLGSEDVTRFLRSPR